MGATSVSTHVVVILASSDWVTITVASYFWFSTTAIFNMISEAMLT
jgi:hypothetical protein